MEAVWKDLVPTVIRLGAPLLGEALGGPLGAAAGTILAQALGASAPTPSARARQSLSTPEVSPTISRIRNTCSAMAMALSAERSG